ncbi:MAG: hypothetical protein HY918_05645 [Candidatus Doudnabacteria bacterium]|nr:hypothetical protein [Candidatus Doudnabacteria bacterium]
MKQVCIYCGNNPVPHRIYWYNETLNIFLTPLRQSILYNPLTQVFAVKKVGQKFLQMLIRVGERLKLVTWQTDKAKCKVRRAQVMWEEAENRAIVMREMLLFGRPIDCYEAKSASSKTIIFSGLPRPEGYLNKWLDLMDDKWLFKKKLAENNLPVPAGGAAWTFSQAKKIFKKLEASGSLPAIVKPRAGSRGRHSTTYVSTPAELKAAYKVAKQLCFWVIIEQQLKGPVYRATVIDFQLSGVLRGDSPQVVGDGQHTIKELADIKNSLPHPGVKNIQTGDQENIFLARQKLMLNSVLPVGKTVSLSEKIGVNYGGSSSEDYSLCHPDNKELFVRAAKILGDPLVGFDFIIPDVAKSFKEQLCGFIEVNSLPFINLHHDPLLGKPQNVAARVWQMVGM